MLKSLQTLVVALTIAATAWAQTQVATISSSGPFELRGAAVTPGQGVPSWPGLAGDVVKAGNTPVTFTFPDGSSIVLAPGSVAKLDTSGQQPVFQLMSGSANYNLKTASAVQLLESTKSIQAKELVGVLKIGGNQPGGGFWTPGHTTAALLVGGGAAAGLGVGIARAVDSGAPVSPSR